MPHIEQSAESARPASRMARDEAQLILGQIHGVVWLAVSDAHHWLKQEENTEGGEPGLTPEDLQRAAVEVHPHFGTVHAALNTGKCDKGLLGVGMTGAQGQAKRKGFWPALSRFVRSTRQSIQDYVTRLRSGLRWSETLIGSIGAAVQEVPGAAAAAEAIKEFLEVLLNATELSEANQANRRTPAKGGSSGEPD